MQSLPRRHLVLAIILGGINIIGLVWIHHDLTARPKATARLLSAVAWPDNSNPDRIRLAFDRNMVPMDLVGQIDEARLFQLKPTWPGKWIWRTCDKLDYILENPLPPGRVVKIAAGEDLTRRTGRTLEGAGELELAIRPLELTSCLIDSYDEHDVTCRVTFNQPVAPGDFLRHVCFYAGEGSERLRDPACLTKAPKEELVVRFPRPESDHFRMVLDADLAGHGGELGLSAPVVIKRRIPEGFSLLNTYVEAPDLESGGSLRLRFSHELSREQEIPDIEIEPRVEEMSVYRYGRTLVVSGMFKAKRDYAIKVPSTLLAANGKTLQEDFSVTVHIPAYCPSIRFAHSKGLLSPWGTMTLDASAVNIEDLELNAWRVHANNLISHLQGARVDATSRSVLDKTVTVDVPDDEPTDLTLDLKELLSQSLGLYRVEVRAANRYWTHDRALVAITDLALTTKRQRDGYVVWVTSLRTAEPVSGVKVAALTHNNQTVATGETDADGICCLRFAGNHPDGGIWVITAQKDSDLTYLLPEENQWVMDDMERSGRPYADHYEIMLYTDRGVYRPGEEIHLTGVIRDADGNIPSSFPLSVKISRPDGRQVADLLVSRQEKDQGMFHTSFATSVEGQTGPYRFVVNLPGSNSGEPLGRATALVEAFVPVRMEVSATSTAERFGPNSVPSIKVTGRYLWDQPASGLPVRVEGTLRPVKFKSQSYKEFTFGPETPDVPVSLPGILGQLDEEGQCEVSIELPETLKPGLYRMWLSATVTEPGGRSVSSNASATLDLLDNYIGLRLREGRVVRVSETLAYDWIGLTGAGELAPSGEVVQQLFRVEYDTVLKWVNDRRVWQSIERTEKLGDDKVLASHASEGSLEITCPESGTYRLVLRDVQNGSSTQLQFHASRYHSDSQTIPMNRPERLEIITDLEKYLPGQQAKILVRSPITGTLLLTTETDHVLAHRIERLAENTLELEVPLPENLRGSVFLTGSVVREIDPNEASWLPHRAMGTAQIKLDHDAQRLPVHISAPAQASPGDLAEVMVDAGRPDDPNYPTFVHLWAVDTGILLTTAYETPDLEAFFLGPRAAGVSTADVFFWLLPDYKRPAGMARIGADDFAYDSLRRNPVATRSRQPAVIWQETAPVDDSGQVRAQMRLPELTGEMRLMAVAVDHDRYGRAEHALTLSAPLQVEASWPRFAAPGDQFEVPVKLFNATEYALTVQLESLISGPIELVDDEAVTEITVQPGRSITQPLRIRAGRVGPVEVKLQALAQSPAGAEFSAKHEASFPIRPAAVPHSEVELRAMPAGQQVDFAPPETLIPGTVRMMISVSSRPAVQLAPALEELIGYPYGCVEQTSSRLFSLLYASQILDPSRADKIDGMVRAGIARLWSMQTPSGGLSYWPGGSTPCLWGTAYSAYCLLEAGNAGYDIDPQFSEDLSRFLLTRLKDTDYETPDVNSKALICRVLAALDQPPHGWMARLAERQDQLDLAGRAHLAAAFASIGDRQMASSLLPERPPQGKVTTTTAGRLTSQVRQETVWLSALLEIDPNHPMVVSLATRINDARNEGHWGSTLNDSAAIAALSRYQALTEQDQPEFTGLIRAGDGQTIRFSHEKPASLKIQDVVDPIQITSEGRGTVYATVTSEGMATEDTAKPHRHGLTVERIWTDRDGEPVDVNQLSIGDLVQVGIVVNTPGEPIHNIAIVDALAGGMEVENPRLATSARTGELAGDRPDHIEFLDDRVILFCTANSEKKVFRYALRVITAGDFSLPPVQASCMYDPGIACLGKGDRVQIRGR